MSLTIIEQLLKQITGVDGASRGSTMVNRAVGERMRQLDMHDASQYAEFVSRSKSELQSLIDELMVTETWFFRDGIPFEFLTQHVQQTWLQTDLSQPLKILSMPCATGEEPYSIAIALYHAGLRKEQFNIDAVDISTRALRFAKRAVFSKHSFRGRSPVSQDRFFKKKKNGYSPKDIVRNKVAFHHLNFWEQDFPLCGYDIVFCRNLLIYFDQVSQQRAIDRLHRLLNEQGLLFVGHAETLCVQHHGFDAVRQPGAFAYRKRTEQQFSEKAVAVPFVAAVPTMPPTDVSAAQFDSQRRALHFLQHATEVSHNVKKVDLSDDQAACFELEQAQFFIDEDEIEQAALICRQHLQNFPNSAQALYLLGLCLSHDGLNKTAAHFFRKAISIEPNHYQALMRFAEALDRVGDAVNATLIRERARRIIIGTNTEPALREST